MVRIRRQEAWHLALAGPSSPYVTLDRPLLSASVSISLPHPEDKGLNVPKGSFSVDGLES